MRRAATLVVFSLWLCSCAGISAERGHVDVGQAVEARTGIKTSWEQGSPEDEQVARRVDALLEAGLSTQSAIGIALVNNPQLQATYEELGVSQAEMVQAGLLTNPTLGGSIAFPSGAGLLEYEASLVTSFLELFVVPFRHKVAQQQFMADVQRVAHQALEVVAEVNTRFVQWQAQQRRVELGEQLVAAAQAAAELAERQYTAGNVTDLKLAETQARYQQSRLQLAGDQLLLEREREGLNRALGLWGSRTNWRATRSLEPMPEREASLEHLESIALRQRLDVDAARKTALVMQNAVELARSTRFVGLVNVGLHVHQDPDGPRLFGPTLQLELPIFDQRQATIAKLEAQERQAQRRLNALSVDARSRVREARLALLAARNVVAHYEQVLLPLRERVLQQSQLQYNGMQVGLYELLDAKEQQAEAERGHVEALRDYWVARAELELQIGGRLGQPPVTTSSAVGDAP